MDIIGITVFFKLTFHKKKIEVNSWTLSLQKQHLRYLETLDKTSKEDINSKEEQKALEVSIGSADDIAQFRCKIDISCGCATLNTVQPVENRRRPAKKFFLFCSSGAVKMSVVDDYECSWPEIRRTQTFYLVWREGETARQHLVRDISVYAEAHLALKSQVSSIYQLFPNLP